MKTSLLFFGSAWLVACNNDSPKTSPEAKAIVHIPEVATVIDSAPDISFDLPVVISEYTRTDYTIRIITLSAGGSDSMRIIQPGRGTNYVIERVPELR